MSDYRQILQSLPKRHDTLLCVDNDGTVFDTMEAKERCFSRCIVGCFGFSGRDAELAEEVFRYVNLDSIHRGQNRFKSLVLTFDYLRERGVSVPDTARLREWVKNETRLGNPALAALLEREPSDELRAVLRWREESNAAIEAEVRGIPPFPHVRETLTRADIDSDIMVVSHTPESAIRREWTDHGLLPCAMYLAGQECGSKLQHIRYASAGKYPPERILVVGDSPGDEDAAEAAGVNFFPIIPHCEADSWFELGDEGLARFYAGRFDGEYQDQLLERFHAALPSDPPWRTRESSRG